MNQQQNLSNGAGGQRVSVLRQLAALKLMSAEQLHAKWRELYGCEPPLYQTQFMIKRLAYRIQELYYGGLSQQVKTRLHELGAGDKLAAMTASVHEAKMQPGRIVPGTRLVREWNGKRYEVVAGELGFEYEGRHYRSLSAIAREITGTHWNGKVFFGVNVQKRSGRGRGKNG
jgi:hypothetical protein